MGETDTEASNHMNSLPPPIQG